MNNFLHEHSIVFNHIIVVSTANTHSSQAGNDVVAVSPSNLNQMMSDGYGSISSNTLSINPKDFGSFALVPLSMLNLPFSPNLKMAQDINLESPSNPLQSSSPSLETRQISSTNVRRKGPKRDVTERKNIPQSNSCKKLSTGETSNNKKDECRRARREDMAKRKRNASKSTGNRFRRIIHNKDGNGLTAKYDLRKSIRRDNSTLCLVCGEKAGQHTYYGGKSCQSCRAFFRRSVHTITR